MHVHMYICIYAYVYTRYKNGHSIHSLFACAWGIRCMYYIYMYTFTHQSSFAGLYIHIFMYMYMHMYMYMYMCMYMSSFVAGLQV